MKQKLQNVLYTEIPLTREIGIKVEEYDDLSLTLSAPLKNNINHKCTAFGGSLYSLAVLTGWGLVYLVLKEHNLSGHIVIHKSNTRFIRPVASDFTASCSFKSPAQCESFLKMYRRKGIARVTLESQIMTDNKAGVIFTGSYVVHSRSY